MIGMDIPLFPLRRSLSSEAAGTRKVRAAKTKAGEKYISARSGLAASGDLGLEEAEEAEGEGGTDPFYTRKLARKRH